MPDEGVEKFGPNSGRFVGWLAVVVAVAAALVTLVDGWHGSDPVVWTALVAVALLVWAILLRPAMYSDGDELELRNPFQSIFVPLAAIEAVTSRLVFVVMTDDDVFRSTAVTTKRRALLKQSHGDGPDGKLSNPGGLQDPNTGLGSQGSFADDKGVEYGLMVEDRIMRLAADARARGLSVTADVRRELAWPILGGLAVLTVLGVVFGVLSGL